MTKFSDLFNQNCMYNRFKYFAKGRSQFTCSESPEAFFSILIRLDYLDARNSNSCFGFLLCIFVFLDAFGMVVHFVFIFHFPMVILVRFKAVPLFCRKVRV